MNFETLQVVTSTVSSVQLVACAGCATGNAPQSTDLEPGRLVLKFEKYTAGTPVGTPGACSEPEAAECANANYKDATAGCSGGARGCKGAVADPEFTVPFLNSP